MHHHSAHLTAVYSIKISANIQKKNCWHHRDEIPANCCFFQPVLALLQLVHCRWCVVYATQPITKINGFAHRASTCHQCQIWLFESNIRSGDQGYWSHGVFMLVSQLFAHYALQHLTTRCETFHGLPLCGWAAVVLKCFHFAVLPLTTDHGIFMREEICRLVAVLESYYSARLKFSELFAFTNVCKDRLCENVWFFFLFIYFFFLYSCSSGTENTLIQRLRRVVQYCEFCAQIQATKWRLHESVCFLRLWRNPFRFCWWGFLCCFSTFEVGF